jgi:two-component system chemotaxis response regulator CheB
MPEEFTKKFSESLNSVCSINVKESENNDMVLVGNAIIARGDFHLKIRKSETFYQCVLSKEKPFNRHRPSVDVMFNSVAENAGKNALGILLTGMGKDGAEGLMAIKNAGGTTIAQSEESCAVFGMPKAAIDMGAVDMVLDIDGIVKKIIEFYD